MRKKNSKHPHDLDLHRAVAVKLKKFRADREETIAEAAMGACLSKASIKKMESGEEDYRITTLYKICVYYGTTLYDIMKGL